MRTRYLERNLVVELLIEGCTPSAALAAAHRSRASEIAAAALALLAACALATVKHGQGRVEALQHDLGRVAVLAGLILPFAGLKLALEVNLGSLLEILLGDAA